MTTIETPTIDKIPEFFSDLFTDDKDELGNDSNFPDAVIMLFLGNDKYAAVNTVTTGPDPMTVNCLVCFASEKEVEVWEAKYMTGEQVTKSFQEARELAISKPTIHGLALQVNGETRHIHWVR